LQAVFCVYDCINKHGLRVSHGTHFHYLFNTA
jgi:hypothetical protein